MSQPSSQVSLTSLGQIESMTGFGKAFIEGSKFTISVEIKTVNHRFKDMRFKMPSLFNSQEIKLRKKIEDLFSRGSFDIYIQYKKSTALGAKLELDDSKIKNFIRQIKKLTDEESVKLHIEPTQFFRSDFYKEDNEKEGELLEILFPAFELAMKELGQGRRQEGSKLIEKLKLHQEAYSKHFDEVKKMSQTYQGKVREKLIKRFSQEASELNIDEPRFLQELVYYLEKLDIDEEIDRIIIHLEKLEDILKSTGDVGRQIDFLVQELGRETNTIGSKSAHGSISENVVQMKVQLEKIREQALNLQ